MLDDIALIIEAENVDTCPRMVAGPFLPAEQNNVIALCNHALELDVFTGVAAGGSLKIGDEPFLTVADEGTAIRGSSCGWNVSRAAPP
jgi:hypothetical protein